MYLFTYIGTYIYTCIHTAHMHIDTYTFSRHMVSVGSQTSAQVMLTEVPKDVPVEDACTWGSKKWLWGVRATWRIIPLNNWLGDLLTRITKLNDPRIQYIFPRNGEPHKVELMRDSHPIIFPIKFD